MAEIAALPWNGYNAVSTFSGCGGSSLGYKMAGFRVLWANEFVPEAQDTYRANHPATLLDTRDIRQVSGKDILDAIGLKQGELDLFDGSPPCASFSTVGRRDEGWGKVKAYSDVKQRTDDLFYEYARLIREVQPRVFVAENVSGLIKGVSKGYFKLILEELKQCGYKVEARRLDAQWLGVPQMRQRLIFIGVRNDLPAAPIFPSPLPYRYSMSEAVLPVKGPVEAETDISRYAIGAEWERTPIGTESTRYIQLKRPALDRPCFTVLATGGQMGAAAVAHPTEKRKFSIAELKRIGGFPDDFTLTGTYEQQWERIGRAVPPVMMMHIATAVKGVLDLCKTAS